MKKKDLKEILDDLPFTLVQEIFLAHFDGRLHTLAMDYLKDYEKWEKEFEDIERTKKEDEGKSFHLFHRRKKK